MCVERLVKYCIRCGYVEEKQAPWLCYALKKRIYSLLTLIPVLILASYLSSLITASFFVFSFWWLRSRVNGFHAKTFLGCMVASMVCVLIIMGPVFHQLTATGKTVLFLGSVAIIRMIAPFNHPNMHLTDGEMEACMKSAKLRLLLLILGVIILHMLNQQEASDGIILGTAMAAFLLVLAYIIP